MTENEKGPCPKCGEDMVCGVMVDRSYTSSEPQQWKHGCSIDPDMYSNLYNVTSYRCTGCGFLENYAFKQDPVEDEAEEEKGPPIL